MREQFDIGSAMQERYGWNSVPMPAPQERKHFDTACDKWDQYQHQLKFDQVADTQQQPQHRRGSRRHSQFLSEATTTINPLPTIPDTISMRNTTIRPELVFSGATPGVQRPHATRMSLFNPTKEIGDDSPDPSHFLARSMRVFVAWKA